MEMREQCILPMPNEHARWAAFSFVHNKWTREVARPWIMRRWRHFPFSVTIISSVEVSRLSLLKWSEVNRAIRD
jgi:hypothetical protein